LSKITTLKLGFSNAFLVRDEGLILVDTGINVPQTKYLQLLKDLQIDPGAINLILITHGHNDHFAHAKWLKEITGAPLLCHKKAVEPIRKGQNPKVTPRNQLGRNVLRRIRLAQPQDYQPIEPDIVIDEEFALTPYGVKGKVIPTPGHSSCSLSVILDSGEALVGDVVISSPFTKKPCLAYFADDEEALLESVEHLANLAKTFYSAHGGPFSREDLLNLLRREREKKV
jgi:hydroxyacylglutathione hydrolase